MVTKIELKHQIVYCDHCEVWTIKCKGCGIGGCSAGHLDNCENMDEADELDRQLRNLLRNTDLVQILTRKRRK